MIAYLLSLPAVAYVHLPVACKMGGGCCQQSVGGTLHLQASCRTSSCSGNGCTSLQCQWWYVVK
jgi:hypothetical protein